MWGTTHWKNFWGGHPEICIAASRAFFLSTQSGSRSDHLHPQIAPHSSLPKLEKFSIFLRNQFWVWMPFTICLWPTCGPVQQCHMKNPTNFTTRQHPENMQCDPMNSSDWVFRRKMCEKRLRPTLHSSATRAHVTHAKRSKFWQSFWWRKQISKAAALAKQD